MNGLSKNKMQKYGKEIVTIVDRCLGREPKEGSEMRPEEAHTNVDDDMHDEDFDGPQQPIRSQAGGNIGNIPTNLTNQGSGAAAPLASRPSQWKSAKQRQSAAAGW